MLVGSVSHLPLSARDQARMFLDRADQAQKAADRATAERYIDLAYSILSMRECGQSPHEDPPPARTNRSRARLKEMAGPAQIM